MGTAPSGASDIEVGSSLIFRVDHAPGFDKNQGGSYLRNVRNIRKERRQTIMANLMKREPSSALPTFQGLQSAINRMFDEVTDGLNGVGTRTWGPPLDIYETDDQLVILAELPGFKRDEIDISFGDGQLTLSGERRTEDEKGRTYHRNERWYGRFERSFMIPSAYDAEKISAKLRDGILTVSLPKREGARPRQIPVSTS
jgi:HSP20 family protein